MYLKRLAQFVLLALLTIGCFGCDEKKLPPLPDAVEAPAAPKESAEQAGPIQILEFKIQASQTAMTLEGVPGLSELEAQILQGLYEQEAFEKDGSLKGKGSAVFDVRQKDESVEVMLVGSVTVPGESGGQFNAEVLVRDADIDDRRLEPLTSEAVRRFVKRVGAQARIKSANDFELIALLQGDHDGATRLFAIQESRDRRLRDAIPATRPHLKSPDERVQVAAAAMLVSLKDEESYSEVIALTEQFSRETNPQMLPMLYIVADLGTDESRTYLAAVAEAHSSEQVRKIAQEAMQHTP